VDIKEVSLFKPGFAPARRGSFDKTQDRLFVSAKGPKTISACARSLWGSSASAPNQDGSETRYAQTVFAKESDSVLRLRRAQRRKKSKFLKFSMIVLKALI